MLIKYKAKKVKNIEKKRKYRWKSELNDRNEIKKVITKIKQSILLVKYNYNIKLCLETEQTHLKIHRKNC